MDEEKIKASQEAFEQFIKGFDMLGERVEQLDALIEEGLVPAIKHLADEMKLHRFEMIRFRQKTANLKNLFGLGSS